MRKAVFLITAVMLSLVFWSCQEKGAGVNIGVILPLTGDFAQYGQSGKKGLTVALENFKKEHPELSVNVVIEDDKADTKTAISAVTKLTDINKVDIIVGAMASGVTLSIAPVINNKKVVLMAPTSTASEVTNAGEYVFRVCVSDAFEGQSMADYVAVNFRDKKIGVVYINNDYGIGLKTNFIRSSMEKGLPIAYESGYNSNTKDFRTLINTLKQNNIDLLYIVAQKEQTDFFMQSKEMNYKPQFTGSTMIEDPESLNRLGDFLDGTVYTYRNYDPLRTDSATIKFITTYKKLYNNEEPDFYAASTYDATYLSLYAKHNSQIEKISIKDYLHTVKDFKGVTGEMTFDTNGDVTAGFTIKTIKNGKFIFQ